VYENGARDEMLQTIKIKAHSKLCKNLNLDSDKLEMSRGLDIVAHLSAAPPPSLIEKIYREHWDDRADLESLATYPYKLSFDSVLRKRGEFVPFRVPAVEVIRSGKRRHQDGIFLHGE
jgi:hypothetical protein